jgi:hypothetical protein
MPSGELVRQSYPGPIRSVGVRPQLAVGMPPHPGMPPPQFAVQHRPVAGYSEVPRHEVGTAFNILLFLIPLVSLDALL